MSKGGEQFGWDALVPRIVHPLRVEIIEALLWIGQPASATLLTKIFDERTPLGLVSYHLGKLAELDVAEKVDDRQVRGAVESFYVLSPRTLRPAPETPAGITISAEQRDALYDQVIERLSAIDDIWIAAAGGDFQTADRLAREFADELRLLCEDLGWGEGSGEAVVLRSPAELLQRVFARFGERAEQRRRIDTRQESEVEAMQRRNALLAETCRQGLAELEEEAP